MSCIKRERVVRPPPLPHSCSAMYFANAEAMSTTIVTKSQTYQPIIKTIQVPQVILGNPILKNYLCKVVYSKYTFYEFYR